MKTEIFAKEDDPLESCEVSINFMISSSTSSLPCIYQFDPMLDRLSHEALGSLHKFE